MDFLAPPPIPFSWDTKEGVAIGSFFANRQALAPYEALKTSIATIDSPDASADEDNGEEEGAPEENESNELTSQVHCYSSVHPFLF